MTAKYEWKVGRNGNRKYVRTVVVAEPMVPTPILAPDPPVVAVEPETITEPAGEVAYTELVEPVKPKRGPGRPKKAAPVVIEDSSDD